MDDRIIGNLLSGDATILDLAGRSPSLYAESSNGRLIPRLYIRGLGNTDFDINASQPVSLIYDDVVFRKPRTKKFSAIRHKKCGDFARTSRFSLWP